MKKILLIVLVLIVGCAKEPAKELAKEPAKEVAKEVAKEPEPINIETLDVCRCLVEPGNTQWAKDNINSCRDAISEKIGVANWETINFSQNPMLDARWESLKSSCGY